MGASEPSANQGVVSRLQIAREGVPRRCPQCDLFNPPGAERCDCGYRFPLPVQLPIQQSVSEVAAAFAAEQMTLDVDSSAIARQLEDLGVSSVRATEITNGLARAAGRRSITFGVSLFALGAVVIIMILLGGRSFPLAGRLVFGAYGVALCGVFQLVRGLIQIARTRRRHPSGAS